MPHGVELSGALSPPGLVPDIRRLPRRAVVPAGNQPETIYMLVQDKVCSQLGWRQPACGAESNLSQ